jgi:DNA-binding Lrp family transcriptional regulator
MAAGCTSNVVVVKGGNKIVTQPRRSGEPPDAPGRLAVELASLDDVDLGIIRILQENGRGSSARIAEALGVSAANVRQRVERLLRTEAVRVVALVDPVVLGRNVVVSLRLAVDGAIGDVAARVAAVPRIAWVGTKADLVTVGAQASVASLEELRDLINHDLRPIPGVRSVSTELYLRIYAVPFDFAGGDEHPEPLPAPAVPWARGASQNRTIDDIDRQLVALLESDARMSFTAMASSVGLSVPAARQRVRRLIADDILRVTARPNPLMFGRTCSAQVLLQVTGDCSAIASHLATTIPTATFVCEIAGMTDIHVEMSCRDEAQLERMYSRIASTPGIQSIRLDRYRDIVKWSGGW